MHCYPLPGTLCTTEVEAGKWGHHISYIVYGRDVQTLAQGLYVALSEPQCDTLQGPSVQPLGKIGDKL